MPEETLWQSLLNGRDPKRNGVLLARAEPSSLDGVVCTGEEQHLYILTEVQHISLFFPSAVTRDRKNNLLLDWEWLKPLPADLYHIIYCLRAEPGRFRAVLDSKLCLDGYPAPSGKANDPDKVAGFGDRGSLRLALHPNALRFFAAGLHEPLRAAWPSVRQVLRHRYVLEPSVRRSVTDKLNAVTPSGGVPWCSTLRSALHERHWPSGPSEPPQAEAELPTPAEPSTNLLAVIRCAARSVEPGEPSIPATRRLHPLLNEEHVMKFAPPASQYSVALAKAEHPDLTPSRISRLVDRMVHKHKHDACGECGSLIGRYHWRESDYDNDYDDGLGCACGEEITYAMHLCADMCPACGKDPWTTELTCKICGEPMSARSGWQLVWPEEDASFRDACSALREGRVVCGKCHSKGDGVRSGECECAECRYFRDEEGLGTDQ